MERICFTLQVDPARIDEYRRRHEDVWPEMLRALKGSGWHDYSLFLRDDGLLIGVLETEDFDAAVSRMEATDVNTRWQAQMAPFFVGLGDGRPDERMEPLPEIFNLEAALERAVTQQGGTPS